MKEGTIRLNLSISHADSLGVIDTNDISDGFHSFGELYEFRCALTNALFKKLRSEAWDKYRPEEGGNTTFKSYNPIWKSKLHSDGTMFPGFFIIGYSKKPGEMITFHYPEAAWDLFDYANILPYAPEWDGHTSADVLERIKNL